MAVPTVAELFANNQSPEILFWVGCAGSFDQRAQKITKAFTAILDKLQVSYAILGKEEMCTGDPARRAGNEFLFQMMAYQNIQTLNNYNIKKIVTACPHCFNIFKNEYPDFGFKAEVYHHTQMLFDLIKTGKLIPQKEINERLTYHDSCYLGRYNGVYDPPREILQAIPGLELVEMKRNRESGMCCGAGGGLMWTEETTGNRINVARTEQAIEVEPAIISSACPFCLTMLSDGTKAKDVDQDISTMDVAEILALSVFVENDIQIA